MADRYSKLFSLAQNLYVKESPVVIAAGALLLDNKTNQVLAQLKVRNIGSKAIKAVTVKITPFDTAGRSLGEPVMSQYLDLALNRDQEFGQKLPIKLPNNATRSFSVAVTEAVFADNEIWTCSQDEWKSLPAAKPLNSWLTDSELEKQYKLQYGQDSSYVPERIEDLWYCACGAINRNDEEICHNCGKSISTLLSIDLAELTAEKDARLKKEAEAEAARLKKEAEEKAERQKREAEEKAAEEAEAAAKRVKAQNITIIVLATLAVIIGAILLLTKVIIPNNNYDKAQAFLAEGKYKEAIAVFEKLGNYKDSAEMILECQYQEAVTLIDSGDYEAACVLLEEIDNNDAIASSRYDRAVYYIDSEDYKGAYLMLDGMDYNNSKELQESIKLQYQKVLMLEAEAGSHVFFGTYEQDNNSANGKEDIEWIVLAREGDRILLISLFALDCQPYNRSDTTVTWETCSLRQWLNGTFLNAAFTENELAMIPRVTISFEHNFERCGTTTDQVFLLDSTEIKKYFSSDIARQCQGTAYCFARDALINEGLETCVWWLRSTKSYGSSFNYAYDVTCVGQEFSGHVNEDDVAVRPALWIELDP